MMHRYRALATYRLQFNSEFPFSRAQELVPYLSRLGVTTLYSSPVLRPRPGSKHGYDVVDPATVNPELGGESALVDLVNALRAHGMGLVLDVVPNHMAASDENPYWRHVLTYGDSSPYARWFDIDWRLPDPEMWGKVLLPILGQPLEKAIEDGEIDIVWDHGRFWASYYEHRLPLEPSTVAEVASHGIQRLEEAFGEEDPVLVKLRRVLLSLSGLPALPLRKRHQESADPEVIEGWLSELAQLVENSPRFRTWAEQSAAEFGQGEAGHHRLNTLLDRQVYRLFYWRRATRLLNYRRFFDINDLISLRQEDPQVFEETHALLRRWLEEGLIEGVRVDHVDGLRDPAVYLKRLSSFRRPDGSPPLVWVEKILAHGERLRDWPVEGTTGYEFLAEVESVFVDPPGFREIERFYRRLVRRPTRFGAVAAAAKRRILRRDLSAYVTRLGRNLTRILGDSSLASAALTPQDLSEAIVETIVALRVYRTYISPESGVSESDRTFIDESIRRANGSERAFPEALDVLRETLLLSSPGEEDQDSRDSLNFVQRFQQVSGPAAAKGVEDTALYAFVPLVSLNEVGCEPDRPVQNALAEFHQGAVLRGERPGSMTCVTTHDTKRSGDVRARIHVLSEIPGFWVGLVLRWRRRNSRLRKQAGGREAPDRITEYLFYQTVVGVWPVTSQNEKEAELVERLENYMVKACREAKLRTDWLRPNQKFEEAVREFVRGLLSGSTEVSRSFLDDIQSTVDRVARPGFWNSLSRTVLQYTAPGTPDLYQGDEVWNFALVDPDNRRPVDFERRQRLLDEIVTGYEVPGEQRKEFLSRLVANPEDGRIKLHVLRRLLQARREHPLLFGSGSYEKVAAHGPRRNHLIAFMRTWQGSALVAVSCRLTMDLVDRSESLAPIGGEVWHGSELRLPNRFAGERWTSLLTGETIPVREDGVLWVEEVLGQLPVAVLILSREGD